MNKLFKILLYSEQYCKFSNKILPKVIKLSKFSTLNKPAVILGIETSFDDTGIAIVDSSGKILGDAINSQQVIHLRTGGVIPTVARELHEDHIQTVYNEALKLANLKLEDIDAIATTVKPGLELPLAVGKNFGKYLSNKANKPFIPIHHMEAHALTVRMVEKVDFPYLVLLISGGHCQLAIVQSVDKFYVLGESKDDAPGEAFDKGARRMGLSNTQEYGYMSGGRAIELAAKKANNANEFAFTEPMTHLRDCNFSFSGIKSILDRHVKKQELIYNIPKNGMIPNVNNLCASYLMIITKHICKRTLRAMEFIHREELFPYNKTLVVSGGVACNDFIVNALDIICKEMDFKLVRTPKKFCTDNGVMIAWNGVERYTANSGVLKNKEEVQKVDVEGSAPLGEDWSQKVAEQGIKVKRVKLSFSDLIRQ